MGVLGVSGYYENGLRKKGLDAVLTGNPSSGCVCVRGAGESWLGLGEGCRGGQARTPRRMGAIHECHAASSVGAGPFFFKLVEPLSQQLFPILPLGLTRSHVLTTTLIFLSCVSALSNRSDVSYCSPSVHPPVPDTSQTEAAQARSHCTVR